MDRGEIEDIVAGQKEYFRSGATKDKAFRKDCLNRLKSNIMAMETEIASALTDDLGKSATESYMTETGMVLESIRYMSRNLDRLSRPYRASVSLAQFPGKARIYPEPYGNTLIISPWNYPLLLALDPLIAAVAAGNCCIIKPSEYAPATGRVLCRLIENTFDKRHVAVIEGDAATGDALLDCRFDYIFFTGGEKVGRIVLEKAARHLTPVTLELGGKSPAIVLKDADIETTARRIAFGKLLNCGQTCVAPDYLLIEKGCKERFIEAFIREASKMYGDNPLENPDYGKIINRMHFDRLSRYIESAETSWPGHDKTDMHDNLTGENNPGIGGNRSGGRIIFGGKRDPERLKIAPTLIDCITPEAGIMQEEIFGPILPVMEVGSAEEAIGYVNSGKKPLAAYIFTRDSRLAGKFIHEIPFGGGCINDTIMHLASTHLPFGGTGESGMGMYHGKWGFDTFTHYKSVLHKSALTDPPVRYAPYGGLKSWLIRKML